MSQIVAVFGSARTNDGSEIYQMAYQVGRALAGANYITMTGGFGGVMEAASRGAVEAGGESHGITVESLGLVGETTTNQWVTKEICFSHLRDRIQHLVNAADAYVVMPGGIGTLQEFVEVWQFMRLGDIPRKPLLVYGEFWNGIIERMLEKGFVNGKDTGYVTNVGSPEALIATLQAWFSED